MELLHSHAASQGYNALNNIIISFSLVQFNRYYNTFILQANDAH